jgi:GT2 family glycosyltransferase
MSEYQITIATATYNRKDVLRMNLDRLARQSLPADRFEMVIVDDGSTDGTIDMLRECQADYPFRLRYFEQSHAGPGAAQNRAASEAEADIVLFLADDMLTTPGVVEHHLNKHRQYPDEHAVIVGQIRESSEMPQTIFQKAWDPFRDVDMSKKAELDEVDFWVSNLSIKKRFFMTQGRFLEHAEPAMEDLELAHRLFKRGMRLIYCADALSFHYHPQTIDSAVHRLYVTGLNFHRYEKLVDHDKIHKFANVPSLRLPPLELLKVLGREAFRLTVFNDLTVPHIVVPTIRKAENNRALRPFVRFLTDRACGYYLRKGISEGRRR